jgi:hypothetical protein
MPLIEQRVVMSRVMVGYEQGSFVSGFSRAFLPCWSASKISKAFSSP